MAFPDDENNGSLGFLKTNLADPNTAIGSTSTSPNGDVTNYAPPRPPVGAAQSREAQIAALMPALPDSLKSLGFPNGNTNPAIVVAPNSASDARDAAFARFGTSLPQGVQDTINSHKNALAEADKYLTVAGHIHQMRNEISSKLDSADYLKDLSTLDHMDPNYESKIVALNAKYPNAGGQLVQDALSTLHGARANYLKAVAPGGADEFTAGSPEQQAYISRLQQTKDPQLARAHAENVAKGEDMVRTNAEKGVINPQEMFSLDAQGNFKHPEFFNPDHSINYHAVALEAAKNTAAGESTKAKLKLGTDAVAAAEKFLTIHKEEPDVENDPQLYKDWHAANSILIRSLRATDRAGGSSISSTPPAATPSGTPPPAAQPSVTPAPVKNASAYTNF